MLDDLPLGGVGILGLIDQHMVDLAVELVADPVAHAGLLQQAPRPFDQVVEIGNAGGSLRLRVGFGERLACTQPRRNVSSKPRAVLDAQQTFDQIRKTARVNS